VRPPPEGDMPGARIEPCAPLNPCETRSACSCFGPRSASHLPERRPPISTIVPLCPRVSPSTSGSTDSRKTWRCVAVLLYTLSTRTGRPNQSSCTCGVLLGMRKKRRSRHACVAHAQQRQNTEKCFFSFRVHEAEETQDCYLHTPTCFSCTVSSARPETLNSVLPGTLWMRATICIGCVPRIK